MARNRLTSTHEAGSREPIAKAKEAALRGGSHMTAEGLAVVLIGGAEEKRTDETKISLIKRMLETSTESEIEATLRGAKADEKIVNADGKVDNTKPINYGPLVVKLCDLGMTLNTAKARASDVRTIASAFPTGDGIDTSWGYWGTVQAAQQRKKDAKFRKEQDALILRKRMLLGEGMEKFGMDVAKAEAYVMQEVAKDAAEAREDEAMASIQREVKRILKMPREDAVAILQQCAAALGFNFTEMTKAEKKEASANVSEPAQVPTRNAEHRETAH